ncbi:MAG: 4Fe-4S dicluster domain-containing protein [Candidatus Electrothrix sp. AUS3]|nr:4Fe-4S dicluster domain-containing protein [Candidatus Electrothrix gigas]
MAERGLLFDIEHRGHRYVSLAPIVVGFWEFTFMRVRPDMPLKELAHLFEKYFFENNCLVPDRGKTQRFRSFVREEAIPEYDHAEVLDWERVTHIVSSASAVSVGICQCYHTAQHLGQACDRPVETCLTFNYAAKSLIQNGIARAITKHEAIDILEKCKKKGLAQIGDNVQRKVTFICNCCGCCCYIMKTLKNLDLHPGIVTSNWIVDINFEQCNGCAECATACPVDAIHIDRKKEGDKTIKRAILAEDACLGCGVCITKCNTGALQMKSRQQRVLVPETIFDRTVAMAIEQGKLSNLLFDNPGKLSHRAIRRLAILFETSPLFKAAMARESIKSTFLNFIVKNAKKDAGDLTELIT